MKDNNIVNLLKIYDGEIRKNVKNKKALLRFERHKMANIINIHDSINELIVIIFSLFTSLN